MIFSIYTKGTCMDLTCRNHVFFWEKPFAVWMWTNNMSIFYNECNIKSGIIPECLFETKRNEFYDFIYSNVKFPVHTRFVGTSTWKTIAWSLKVVTVKNVRKWVKKSHDLSYRNDWEKIRISKFLKAHRNQCFRCLLYTSDAADE